MHIEASLEQQGADDGNQGGGGQGASEGAAAGAGARSDRRGAGGGRGRRGRVGRGGRRGGRAGCRGDGDAGEGGAAAAGADLQDGEGLAGEGGVRSGSLGQERAGVGGDGIEGSLEGGVVGRNTGGLNLNDEGLLSLAAGAGNEHAADADKDAQGAGQIAADGVREGLALDGVGQNGGEVTAEQQGRDGNDRGHAQVVEVQGAVGAGTREGAVEPAARGGSAALVRVRLVEQLLSRSDLQQGQVHAGQADAAGGVGGSRVQAADTSADARGSQGAVRDGAGADAGVEARLASRLLCAGAGGVGEQASGAGGVGAASGARGLGRGQGDRDEGGEDGEAHHGWSEQ